MSVEISHDDSKRVPGHPLDRAGAEAQAVSMKRHRLLVHLFLIFAVALSVRLFFAFTLAVDTHPHDAMEYGQLAQSLLEGRGFSRPDGTPTAARPPLYPAVLALTYGMFGPRDALTFLIQGILLAFTCLLTCLAGREICGTRIGLIAGWGAAVYPLLIFPANDRLSEGLFIFLFVSTLFALLKSRQMKALFFLAGILAGLTSLAKPLALFTVPFFLFWLWRNEGRGRAKAICLFTLALVIALLPWTIRNYQIFGSFVPITTGGGLALYHSYVLSPQGLGFNAPEVLPPEFFSIANEAEQSRYLVARTLDHIVDCPLNVARLVVLKASLFFYPFDGYWYPLSLGSKFNIFWGLVFSFSIAGLFSRPVRPEGRELVLLSFAAVIVGAVVFTGIPRYRLVLEPLFLILAAKGLTAVWGRARREVFLLIGANIFLWIVFRFTEAGDLLRWTNWSAFF